MTTIYRHAFYECRDIPKVQIIAFSRPNPWLIPVNIASLSGNDIKRVPQTISIFKVQYKLAGITVNASNHFTVLELPLCVWLVCEKLF